MSEYDGVILGSGHNSLILQAYACRAGMRVVCIERRGVAGGGLATMENPRLPGFLHNTHSFFHRALTQMPWYTDLELASRGAEYIEPELNAVLIRRDGETLEWWTSFERTCESFAAFSERDARTLREWRDRFVPVLEKILVPESRSVPEPPEARRSRLSGSAEGRMLLEVSELSPLEFVQREFENPFVRAGLLFFNGLREVDLRCKGFGHHIPALLASPGKAQMCRGGSAALARALVSAVEAYGGEIRLNTEPKRIVLENGRAAGVETADGELIRARRFVASGLNPGQTFLELMDEGDVPEDWRRKAREFRYNVLAPLFALDVALREPPSYGKPHLARAFMVILGLDRDEQFSEIVRHHEAGTLAPTVMWGACPTVFDSSQAPAGMHTAFMWEKTPYALGGDALNWDREKEAHGHRMLDLWMQYAPNLRDAVLDVSVRSALDTERTFPNMKYGDLLVGAFANGQVGYHRPFEGAGQYRGHVAGLYLCGSSSHPGGNVTGLPGYNCARVVVADCGG